MSKVANYTKGDGMNKQELLEISSKITILNAEIKVLTNRVANYVMKIIKDKFPALTITTQERGEEGYEFWILVDRGSFKNEEFLRVITEIDMNVLFYAKENSYSNMPISSVGWANFCIDSI